MIDLEERLEDAARAVRTEVARVPTRSPDSLIRRRSHARAVSALSVIVVLAVALLVGARLLDGTQSDLVAQPDVTRQTAPAAGAVAALTMDMPGWSLVSAYQDELGSKSLTFLADVAGERGPRRVQVETGDYVLERETAIETLDLEPAEVVDVADGKATIFLPGADASPAALASIPVLWSGPGAQEIAIVFEGLTADEVRQALGGVRVVDGDEWAGMLASRQTVDSTTTSIEEQAEAVRNTVLGIQLAEAVAGLPGLPAGMSAESPTQNPGDVGPAIGVEFTTDDSALQVGVQRLSQPLPREVADPDGSGDLSTGPDGEWILFMEKSESLQLIAVDVDNLVVNITVGPYNAEDPFEPGYQPSLLKAVDQDILTQWALVLLDAMRDRL